MGGSTRIRTGNQRPTPYLGSRKMVGVTLDARPPNSHAQPGEPPEPPYECGDRGWGEETTNPKEPPATPNRTPQASRTRTFLAADRGRYDVCPIHWGKAPRPCQSRPVGSRCLAHESGGAGTWVKEELWGKGLTSTEILGPKLQRARNQKSM